MSAAVSARRISALALAPLAALTLLAGCGGSDDSEEAGSATDACEGTALEYTNVATGETISLENAAAVSLVGGGAYTVYAADFDIDEDSISALSNPTVPADGNMATIALTIFNATEDPDPIEAGTTIDYTRDFGVLTFTIVHNLGETVFGTSTDATGAVEVGAVGDTVCLDVDYSDGEKAYAGTVEAAVKDL